MHYSIVETQSWAHATTLATISHRFKARNVSSHNAARYTVYCTVSKLRGANFFSFFSVFGTPQYVVVLAHWRLSQG